MRLVFGCSTVVVVLTAIALAFLIIATLTPPVSSTISLAKADGVLYGVLGYCYSANSTCHTAAAKSFPVTSLGSSVSWSMDDAAREKLVEILVVTPVAAAITLLSFIFSILAHFKVFGGSVFFFGVAFALVLLAFIASALTVIVDFLLFYPHITWVSWILIPSAALNLIAVPLMFFALKVTPQSFSGHTAKDEGEFEEDRNLTDLTDGGDFKKGDSFKLQNIETSSLEKAIPDPTLKVITNDSSSLNDEKVSIHDYSKTSRGGSLFGYYSNGNINGQTYTQVEGEPNFVSSTNFNNGGAVRTEINSIQPQSVRPEYTSTSNTGLSGSSFPQSSREINPPAIGLESNSTGLIDNESDNDSDFTSVSQRAVNPNYYRGGQNYGPSLFPNQQQQQMAQPYSGRIVNQPALAPNRENYAASSIYTPQAIQFQHESNTSTQYHPQQYTQPQQQQQQSQSQYAQQKSPRKPNSSDILLSNNPDFMITGAASKKTIVKRDNLNPPTSGTYRPAYKRIHGINKSMPAASSGTGGPYNFR